MVDNCCRGFIALALFSKGFKRMSSTPLPSRWPLVPEDIGRNAVFHTEDTAAADIGTAGSPSVIAEMCASHADAKQIDLPQWRSWTTTQWDAAVILRDVTIKHLVEDLNGREADAVHKLLGVLTSTARHLDEAERAALARGLLRLAAAIEPDIAVRRDNWEQKWLIGLSNFAGCAALRGLNYDAFSRSLFVNTSGGTAQ
jgi:hypothetical protein